MARGSRKWALLLATAAVLIPPGAATAHDGGHHVPPGPDVALRVMAQGLVSPVALTEAPDGSGRLFVVGQTGLVRILSPWRGVQATFLDIANRVVPLRHSFDERGLLGLAFHPGYATNGRFFVYYSAPRRPGAPPGYDHTSRISEFRVSAADRDRADPASERVLLEIDQPQFNHNGGTVAFGPDGYLYVSVGDGGRRDDTGLGHVEDWYAPNAGGNGQDVEANLLGNILRIDVDRGTPYAVPDDNPFVGRAGLDEIFAFGFRNPYRFSFDPGGERALLAGDAGQDLWEEVDVVVKGGNYGWNVREGTHCFSTATPRHPPAECPRVDPEGRPLRDPVIEFLNSNRPHGVGLAVVGGHVHRGSLPQLHGRYVFGTWAVENPFQSGDHEHHEHVGDGAVFVAKPRKAGEGLWPFEKLSFTNTDDGELGDFLLGFGQDRAGEVYVLTSDHHGPHGNSGKVYKIVHPSGRDTSNRAVPPGRARR